MSCVFQNIDPPPPPNPLSARRVCPPPARKGGTHSPGGGSIFWKTHDKGLASYSNNLSTVYTHSNCLSDCVKRERERKKCSVVDPGCFYRIPNQTFFHPGSRIQGQMIPDQDPHQKFLFLSSRICDPGYSSRIRILIFLPIPDPGPRGCKGTGSRIRNTGKMHAVVANVLY